MKNDEALQEGYEAYADGKPLSENPYELATTSHSNWDFGWHEAKYDRQEYLQGISPFPDGFEL